MPIPVPIPGGARPITDADTALAEALLAAFAQVVEFGTSGATTNTPALLIPQTTNPPVSGGLPQTTPEVLDNADKQLFFRQMFVAIAQSVNARTLPTKAGSVLLSSFAGTPLVATVDFVTPFADANYAVIVTARTSAGGAIFNLSVESQAADSFVINLNIGVGTGLIAVDWIAIKNGETS